MTDVRRALLQFETVVDLPLAERERVLRELAAAAPDVHDLVQRMLVAEPDARTLLARPALGIAAVAAARAMPAAEFLPRRSGRFELVDVLGAGGSSVVYRAMQDRPHRPVALKVFLGLSADDEALVQREAELQAQLHHPGVVHVYDQGVLPDGLPFVAMELIEGPALSEWLAQAPPTAARLAVFGAIAATLQYLHANGVLHRDLKPEHIRIESIGGGLHPRLLDFGVAQRLAETGVADAAPAGTVGYMSPEQRAGQADIDGRSDLFALGALALEMFGGEDGRIPDPNLAAIIARCRAEDRNERYPDTRALLDDLDRLQCGRPVAARNLSPVARLWQRIRRGHRLVGVVLATLSLSGALIYFVHRAGTAEARLATHTDTMHDLLRGLDEVAGTAPQRRAALLRLLGDAQAAVATNPADEGALRCLAELQSRLGDLAIEYGDLDEARRQRGAVLAVWQTLLDAHPADRATIVAWADARVRLGDVRKAERGAPAAREDYRAAHERFLAIAEQAHDDRVACDDLAWSWARLAEIETLRGDLEAATRSLDQRFELLQRLQVLAPTHPSTLAGTYEAHAQRAEVAFRRQDATAAEDALRGALAAARRWVTSAPGHVHAQAAVIRACVSLSSNARARGEPTAAAEFLAEAEAVAQKLAKSEPDHDRSVEARAAAAVERTHLLRAQGHHAEARATMEELVTLVERWHRATGARTGVPAKLLADYHRLAAECARDTGATEAAAAHLAAADRLEGRS